MKMPIPRNVSGPDRIVRVLAGGTAAAVPIALGVAWPIAVPVALFGGGIAASGLMGRCSIYHMLGISTRTGDPTP